LHAAEAAALVATASLQASATMRECAAKPLNRAAALLAPAPVLPHHTALAAACPSTSPAEFAALVRMWDLLMLEKHAPHPNDAPPTFPVAAPSPSSSPPVSQPRSKGERSGSSSSRKGNLCTEGGTAGTGTPYTEGGPTPPAGAAERARAAAASKAPPAAVCPPLSLALATLHCSPRTASLLEARMRLLTQIPRGGFAPVINGRAVAGVSSIPPRLRASAISALHVALRLRGEAPLLLEACDVEEALRGMGAASCFEEEGWAR
jgi:hypothetical protein